MRHIGPIFRNHDGHVFFRCRMVAEEQAAKRPALQKERKPIRWHPAFSGFSTIQPFEFKAEEEEDLGA